MTKTTTLDETRKTIVPEALVEIPATQPDATPTVPSRSTPTLPTGTSDPTIKNK